MIGIDILELERVKNFVNNDKLLKSIFFESEIEYFLKYKNPCERIAGCFCAKEAVKKAFCCEDNISFLDIEVLHKNSGQPFIVLHNNAEKCFKKNNYKNIEISISHTKTIATAICKIDY